MSTYKLTISPSTVHHLPSDTFIPKGHPLWDEYEAWLAAGNTPIPAGPTPNSAEHYRAIQSAAFSWMAEWVRARGYDDIPNCASYFNSSITRYRQEARALVAWRDAVNQKLEQLVLAPPVGVETWEQVRALLPQPEAFSWPEKAELPLDMGDKVVLT